MMKSFLKAACLGLSLSSTIVFAHGNVTPQKVDITGLEPVLGTEWVDENPYYGNPVAVKIGQGAYAQNCAMCHGMAAVSGGIAPDLRATFMDMVDNPDEESGAYESPYGDELFKARVQNGVVRNGAVYMPKMAEKISQEALWTIWTFISTLCSPEMVDAEDGQCTEVGDTKLQVKTSLVPLYNQE